MISLSQILCEYGTSSSIEIWRRYLIERGISPELANPVVGWKNLEKTGLLGSELYFVASFAECSAFIRDGKLEGVPPVTFQDREMNKQVGQSADSFFLATSTRTSKGYGLSQKNQGNLKQVLFRVPVEKLKSFKVGKPTPYQMFNVPGSEVNKNSGGLNKRSIEYLTKLNGTEDPTKWSATSIEDLLEYEVRIYPENKEISLDCITKVEILTGNSMPNNIQTCLGLYDRFGKEKVCFSKKAANLKKAVESATGQYKPGLLTVSPVRIKQFAECLWCVCTLASKKGIDCRDILSQGKEFIQSNYYLQDISKSLENFEAHFDSKYVPDGQEIRTLKFQLRFLPYDMVKYLKNLIETFKLDLKESFNLREYLKDNWLLRES